MQGQHPQRKAQTMTRYSTQDLQEEFWNVIRTSQETVVEVVKTCVDTVKTVTPKVPVARVPLAEKLPSSQRHFAEELVKATAPLMPGNDTQQEQEQGDAAAE